MIRDYRQIFIDKAKLKGDFDFTSLNYVNASTHIELKCNKHAENFRTTPERLLNGQGGCPSCGKEKYLLKKRENLITKGNIIHNNKYSYEKVVYKGAKDLVTFVCPVHGDFEQSPSNHLSGYGCMECGRENTAELSKVTEDHIIKRLTDIYGDKFGFSNFRYINGYTPVTLTCKEHNDFSVLLTNLYKGRGCPKCDQTTSRNEKKVVAFLKRYVDLLESDRTLIKPLELDIVVPHKRLAIEYNGLYWHSSVKVDKNYHLNKTNLCESKDIQLVHIFSDEWTEKEDIVKSRLLNLMGESPIKIYARKTVVKAVPTKEAMSFLEQNHLQGKVGGKVKLGLYYNGELVSLMTFGGLRKNLGRNTKEGSYELLRFCNRLNTNVVGGASKLLKYFENNYSPQEIISYADRRWSIGDLYYKLGFKFQRNTPPNYYYVHRNTRLGRFNFRKDILVKDGEDPKKTEKEIMENKGYSRIYDSGAMLFSKINNPIL